MHSAHREPRQHGITVKRLLVFSLDMLFGPGAFIERHVAGRERIAQPESSRYVTRYKAVSSACHSPVEFREEQNICRGQCGVMLKKRNYRIQAHATLDVPGDSANRVANGGRGYREFFLPDRVQDGVEVRLQFSISRRAF